MDYVELFNDSFERVISVNSDSFFEQFYGNFTGKSEQVAKAFENTNMRRQISMLEHSLMMMVDFASDRSSSEYIERLAQFHIGKNIANNTFDLWLDALIETLYQADAQFSENDALAWRIMLSPGIEFMKYYKS